MQHAEVCHNIANFAAAVELDAPDNPILDTQVQAGFLQGAGLGVYAVHHGATAWLDVLPTRQVQHLPNHKVGLFVLGISLVDNHIGADRFLGYQFLFHAHAIVGDQGAGGVEDVAGGAVVLLKGNGSGIGVVLLEAEDIPDVCVAP